MPAVCTSFHDYLMPVTLDKDGKGEWRKFGEMVGALVNGRGGLILIPGVGILDTTFLAAL